MSLQTAPLGQLSGLNLPYSIPTYDKGPSLWEKALSTFLANAAGQVAQNVTSNVTSRDYAKDNGGENARGLDRFLHGPKMDEKHMLQMKSEAQQRELENTRQTGENTRQSKSEAAAQTRQDAELKAREQGRRSDSNDRWSIADATQRGNARQSSADAETQRQLAELRAMLEAKDPKNVANARYLNAEADAKEMFSKKFSGTSGIPAAKGEVNPNIAASLDGGGAQPSQYDNMGGLQEFGAAMQETPVARITQGIGSMGMSEIMPMLAKLLSNSSSPVEPSMQLNNESDGSTKQLSEAMRMAQKVEEYRRLNQPQPGMAQ